MFANPPLDPFVSSQNNRFSLPEKLQDIITELDHKKIFKFDQFFSVSIRIESY
jgi:hypothetical protein